MLLCGPLWVFCGSFVGLLWVLCGPLRSFAVFSHTAAHYMNGRLGVYRTLVVKPSCSVFLVGQLCYYLMSEIKKRRQHDNIVGTDVDHTLWSAC